ncbi:MAG TPA: transporter substrate-binding domain-containing protein [Clostridiales bacterium]|nr:transporter substrate-binding domain-containing protein [Clostridiales bacterium]
MGKIRTYIALLIILTLCLSSGACNSGEVVSGYRLLDGLPSEDFSIAFRKDDKLYDIVTAALAVLAAEGTVSRLSEKWFGTDLCALEGNENALNELDMEIPQRIFIMGIDENAFPMSFKEDSGDYSGFDVELAREVCRILDWELKFQPISPANAEVELPSGNIDCAWGGMSFAPGSESFSVIPSYMSNEQALLVRADSGIKRTGKLKGKTLYMPDRDAAAKALEDNKDLMEDLGQAKRISGDARACLEYLDKGLCDAILIDGVAAKYFMK